MGAALRVPRGNVRAVDLWRSRDQSGNRPGAVLENARAEGVADRVIVQDGDVRRLQYATDRFDVVLCGLVLNNMRDALDRRLAVGQLARVTKPGGTLVIQDFGRTAEYATVLKEMGWTDVRRTRPSLWLFPPARVLVARKPVASADKG